MAIGLYCRLCLESARWNEDGTIPISALVDEHGLALWGLDPSLDALSEVGLVTVDNGTITLTEWAETVRVLDARGDE